MRPTLFDIPMPMATPRLRIRPPQKGDGGVINEAIVESAKSLQQFMPWAKTLPSIDDSEEFVRRAQANWILIRNEEPYLPLFLFDNATSQFVGSCGYHHFDWSVPCLEIGYWIRTSRTGHGLITEAVNALTRYAFKELNVARITITCERDNLLSKRIPERLGFEHEAIIKSNRRTTTGYLSDTLVFARFNVLGLPELEVTW